MVDVLFFDNHLLVLNKPIGMVTQPNGSETSLEEEGKDWLKKKFDKKGKVFLEAVHRLDKPVSGIVLFAKTSKALARLQEKMREKEIKKHYLAMVEGRLEKKEGILEDFLSHDDFRAFRDPKGKKAILEYKVLKEEANISFLEIALLTGRYHQIRCQFAARGYPILGDRKYGSFYKFPQGIALHHFRLTFPHPITQKTLFFEAPPPF